MSQTYDNLVLGGYYTEDYLKESGHINNCKSIGKIYDLVLTPDKSATDEDVTSRNVPSKEITDESYVYRVVEKGLGPQDVNVQDQTTPAVIGKFNNVQGGSVTDTATVINAYTITILDATDFIVGTYVVMYSTVIDRYYLGYVLEILGNVLTMDTPIDAVYPVGSIVGAAVTNMNVDGSGTPVVFGLRGAPVENPLNLTFDITRIIFSCITDSPCDLSTFGNLPKLLRGLVLRKRDGDYYNIFNCKSNGDIDGITLDLKIYAALNPAQGQDGFTARLTFAGQDKIGVVQRLAEGEDLEFLVQDDLTDITLLEVVAEGHIVDYGIYND